MLLIYVYLTMVIQVHMFEVTNEMCDKANFTK